MGNINWNTLRLDLSNTTVAETLDFNTFSMDELWWPQSGVYETFTIGKPSRGARLLTARSRIPTKILSILFLHGYWSYRTSFKDKNEWSLHLIVSFPTTGIIARTVINGDELYEMRKDFALLLHSQAQVSVCPSWEQSTLCSLLCCESEH